MYDKNRDKLGLILRLFATDKNLVARKITQTYQMIEAAVKAHRFDRIDILIWADPRYESDCGKTADACRKTFAYQTNVFITEITQGDLFCTVLNYGIALQLKHGIGWSMIVSPEVYTYMQEATINQMLQKAKSGARVIGLAINELKQSVNEGRIANTFALWHTVSLVSVGCFDLHAQAPMPDNKLATYIRGCDDTGQERFYPLSGIEEIIPLCRMVATYGKCIGVVEPQDGGFYQEPNSRKDPEGYARHKSKIATKLQRQSAMAYTQHCELSFLRYGIIS